jgi:hypothetical protein
MVKYDIFVYLLQITCIIVLFVETPRKFITAKIINLIVNLLIYLRGVSTNKTIIYFIAMQTYKELKLLVVN